MFARMRGRGSLFGLWLMGALLLWVGVAQIELAGAAALVVLVPGAMMFGIGASALYRRAAGEGAVAEKLPERAVHEARIIPFPRPSK